MGSIASQITSLTIVYSAVYSGADQRKHQSPASLAFVGGIHRGSVNSPHKWPVTRKMFPFDDVIMRRCFYSNNCRRFSVIPNEKTSQFTDFPERYVYTACLWNSRKMMIIQSRNVSFPRWMDRYSNNCRYYQNIYMHAISSQNIMRLTKRSRTCVFVCNGWQHWKLQWFLE